MPTKKTARKAKAGSRGKKLAKAKKMNDVKPLAVNAYLKIDGVSTE